MSSTSGLDRAVITPRSNHGVPGCSVQTGDAELRGPVDRAIVEVGQEVELVRRHDEVGGTGVVGWRPVGDQTSLTAGRATGLDDPLGDVGHERVALRGDEHVERSHRLSGVAAVGARQQVFVPA